MDVDKIRNYHHKHRLATKFSRLADICPLRNYANCTTYVIKLLNVGGLSEYVGLHMDLGGFKHTNLIFSNSLLIPVALFTVGIHIVDDDKTPTEIAYEDVIGATTINTLVIKLLELFAEKNHRQPRHRYKTWVCDTIVALAGTVPFVAFLLLQRHELDHALNESRICSAIPYDILTLFAACLAALLGASVFNCLILTWFVNGRIVKPTDVYEEILTLIRPGPILPRGVERAIQTKQLLAIWPTLFGYLAFEATRRFHHPHPTLLILIASSSTIILTSTALYFLFVCYANNVIQHHVENSKRLVDNANQILDQTPTSEESDRANAILNQNENITKLILQLDRNLLQFHGAVLCCLGGMVGMKVIFEKYTSISPDLILIASTPPGMIGGHIFSLLYYPVRDICLYMSHLRNPCRQTSLSISAGDTPNQQNDRTPSLPSAPTYKNAIIFARATAATGIALTAVTAGLEAGLCPEDPMAIGIATTETFAFFFAVFCFTLTIARQRSGHAQPLSHIAMQSIFGCCYKIPDDPTIPPRPPIIS